jgi:hypothetical protein
MTHFIFPREELRVGVSIYRYSILIPGGHLKIENMIHRRRGGI